MKTSIRILGLLSLLIMLIGSAFAQPPTPVEQRPAPRLPDGTVNLGQPPGKFGFWSRAGTPLFVNPKSYEAGRRKITARIDIKDIPLQPWAQALIDYRNTLALASEPYTRCKPAGGPREIMSPYGFEILQMPELQRVYILTVSDAMSYRTIYMDGRAHPTDLVPAYFGHSVGHWEGDTLVVDTVGMNERSWMNREGMPSTEQLHLIERFTRSSLETMDYTVTVDDPGAYTAPWTSGFNVSWNEGEEIFEYVCQENNLSPASMIGDGRMSLIVP